MSYNTNYDIIEKDTEKVLFSNSNNSCFAQLSYSSMTIPKDSLIRVYHASSVVRQELTDEMIFWWLTTLSSIGLPLTHERKEFGRRTAPTPMNSTSCVNLPTQEYDIWTLDTSEYDSKGKIMLALHMVRHMYEYNMPAMIKEAYNVHQKNPDEHPYTCFIYASMYTSSTGGHVTFYSGTYRPRYNKDQVDQLFKDFTKEFSGNEVSKFTNLFIVRTNSGGSIPVGLIMPSSNMSKLSVKEFYEKAEKYMEDSKNRYKAREISSSW